MPSVHWVSPPFHENLCFAGKKLKPTNKRTSSNYLYQHSKGLNGRPGQKISVLKEAETHSDSGLNTGLPRFCPMFRLQAPSKSSRNKLSNRAMAGSIKRKGSRHSCCHSLFRSTQCTIFASISLAQDGPRTPPGKVSSFRIPWHGMSHPSEMRQVFPKRTFKSGIFSAWLACPQKQLLANYSIQGHPQA